MKTNGENTNEAREIRYLIPPPPGVTAEEWRFRSAGMVGDYRPLAERLAEEHIWAPLTAKETTR